MDTTFLKAYSYFLSSKDWFIKLAVLTCLNIPALYIFYLFEFEKIKAISIDLIFFIILALIFVLIQMGYCAKITQNLIYLPEENPHILPQWSTYFLDYLVIGLKKFYFYFIAGFGSFFQNFSFKNWAVSEQGVDLALEGHFCHDFNNIAQPDYSSMYDTIRSSLGLYFTMSSVNAIVPISFVIIILLASSHIISFWFVAIFAPIFFTLYLIVAAYFASVSAKYAGPFER